MTPESAMTIFRDMLMTTLWLSAPLLVVGFIAGILISLVQVLTSMQDSAFGSVPRLLAFFGAALFAAPWMLQRMMTYTADILGNLGRYAR
jgi:flagellar biosynthetic protein FliQ